MSYCRFSDGDVYMFPSHDGHRHCCMCKLREGNTIDFRSAVDALDHLTEHRQAGHRVPQYAIVRLICEKAEEQ